MDARARYDADTTLFRLYVSFRDDCATFTSFTRSKREILRIRLIKSRADQEFRKICWTAIFFCRSKFTYFFFLIGNSSFSLMFRTDYVRNGRVPKYPKLTERYPSNPKYTRFRARISNTLSLRWTFFGSIMTRLFIPRTSVFVRVFQTLFVSVVTLTFLAPFFVFVFFWIGTFSFSFFSFFLLARVIPRV